MQFGIFDQNDHGPYPLAEQYENRLQLIEFYDRAGFRTYHMSEHHSTPLNLTPSPSVFLAAAAQRTKGSAHWFTFCRRIIRCGLPKKSACWII